MRSSYRRSVLAPIAAVFLAGCVPAAEAPDIDGDGWVGAGDVARVNACIGLAPSTPGCEHTDTNRDGVVDSADLFSLTADFGKRVCNGVPSYCDRRYDQVSYPTSHNAFSTWALFTLFFNQWDDMTVQMNAGIRGLMLDAWYHDGNGNGTIEPSETYLCHSDCNWSRQPLDQGLAELTAFLETHPGDVLTLIFESYISPTDMASAFDRAGLTQYALPYTAGSTWPTLREMVESGKRLVVVSDRTGTGSPSWYVNVWAVASETPFSNANATDLTCAPLRGNVANPLFILNHFLTRNSAVPQEASNMNANPFLVERARQCWRTRNRLPNYPTVDFATTGSVVEAARMLNADWAANGGSPPPAP